MYEGGLIIKAFTALKQLIPLNEDKRLKQIINNRKSISPFTDIHFSDR